MIQVVNILLGLWSVHQAWYATTLIQEFNIQVFAIMLFIFTEAVQGVLLIFAPAPKVKVRRPTNFVWVVLLLICVMEAGVNVVKSPLPHSPGFILILLGQILSFWAVISLGRMFGIFSEARGICTSGPYKYLKHPMYVGYAFTYIGLALQTDSPKAWYFLLAAILIQVIRAYQESEALAKLRNKEKIIIQRSMPNEEST